MIQSTVLSLLSLGLWKVEPQDEESVVQPSFSLHGSGNQRETQRSQGTNIHLENKVQRPKFLLVPPHVLKVPQLPKRTPLWTPSLNTQDFRGKESSTSLVIRELQIKSTLGFYLTPVRMTKVKNSGDSRCWRGCGERGTLFHCWWDCKLVQPLWTSVWRFLRKLDIVLPEDPANRSWAYAQKMLQHLIRTHAPLCSQQPYL